jgi:hypothetical protein
MAYILDDARGINSFNRVLLPAERGRLQALADDAGLKESEIVRLLIEQAYVARFGKRKPPWCALGAREWATRSSRGRLGIGRIHPA